MEKEAPVQRAPRWFISVCACHMSLGSGFRVCGFVSGCQWRLKMLPLYLRGLGPPDFVAELG